MLLVLPIRTESTTRRTPQVNYVLIGVNVALHLLLHDRLPFEQLAAWKDRYLAFHADQPGLHQFITYQFLHADTWHLLGNMLFLWVFGNSVNAKMGDLPYLLFYLAGGVFAAWGFAVFSDGPTNLIGASGAVASVTTAYLVLFPRCRVTVLLWVFIFIRFIEVSSLYIILLKIVVWDNIVTPTLGGQGNIAHTAHLAGYLFGFLGSLFMLVVRAIPRDHFDIMALWKRWNQRREFAATMSSPEARSRAQFGAVGAVDHGDPKQRAIEDQRLDAITEVRSQITDALDKQDTAAAAKAYEKLMLVDAKQCLAERHQLTIAREFYGSGRFSQATAAFERFVESYPYSLDANDVRLLVGIIYARDLQQYEAAEKHLKISMESLRDEARRSQCAEWLERVRESLGRSAPQT